jgi:hypothetical protein
MARDGNEVYSFAFLYLLFGSHVSFYFYIFLTSLSYSLQPSKWSLRSGLHVYLLNAFQTLSHQLFTRSPSHHSFLLSRRLRCEGGSLKFVFNIVQNQTYFFNHVILFISFTDSRRVLETSNSARKERDKNG